MDDFKPGNQMPDSVPVSIEAVSRLVIAYSIRKWSAGAALTERERQVVDDALAGNRFEMVATVFAVEAAHVR